MAHDSLPAHGPRGSLRRRPARVFVQSRPTGKNGKMANKPTIILVHGFWGGAAHWGKVIGQLSKMGYDTISAVENPLTSLADDAERTRKMVAQLKGPVLLVGHSYGGAVITAGRQPAERGRAGLYRGVRAGRGRKPRSTSDPRLPPPPGVANVAPDSDGYVWINPAKFGESFCQDLPADEAAGDGRHPESAGRQRRSPTRSARPPGRPSRPGTRSPARTG